MLQISDPDDKNRFLDLTLERPIANAWATSTSALIESAI
jgi:hypothetical protein